MRVRLAHASMQFSDTEMQMRRDTKALFDRDYDVITGTESGPDNPLHRIVPAVAGAAGYRLAHFRTNWVAVHRRLVVGDWRKGYVPVIESWEGAGHHSDRGIVWAGFLTSFGRMTVGSGHYLTNGRRGEVNFDLNRRYARAIGDWARHHGKGGAVVFFNADVNTIDRRDDVFYGEPLTTCWDELKSWPNTGHGNIDVIASYDRDGRVSCERARALSDSKIRLNTDHFLIEAVYDVKTRSPREPA